jgi:hypothetical protein
VLSEHHHPGGRAQDELLIVGQQQGLLARQPVGSGADLALAIEEQQPRQPAALALAPLPPLQERGGKQKICRCGARVQLVLIRHPL